MKTINNEFLIDIELKESPFHARPFETRITDNQGTKMTANSEYNKYEYANQTGIVVCIPNHISNEQLDIDLDEPIINDLEIKEGDKVWFHHLATSKSHKLNIDSKTLYKQKYRQIYAVEREGKIYPTERNVFIRPLYQNEEDIISKTGIILKPAPDKKPGLGKIVACSSYCKSIGLVEDSIVMYSKLAEYELNYMDPVTYVTNPRWLWGVFE